MSYHNIITRAELMELPIEEQRALMQEYRKRFSVEKICRDTGIPYGGSFYNYLRYLGLPTNANTRGNKRDMGVATMNLYDKNIKMVQLVQKIRKKLKNKRAYIIRLSYILCYIYAIPGKNLKNEPWDLHTTRKKFKKLQ